MHLAWATSMLRARCQHVSYAQQVRRALHTNLTLGEKATSPLHARACGRDGSQSRATTFGNSSHQRRKVGNVSVRALHRGAIAQTPTLFAAQPTERIYSQTVKLPNTRFELLREGTNREDLYRPRTSEELYRWQIGQKERPTFVLQDGPPYANGKLHLGHTVNKVLKDIINRYNVLKGKRVEYIPGWDCHGLPIEQKVVSKFPGVSPDKIDPLTMRQECRKYASDAVDQQRNDFQRLGIMADWSKGTTYRTYEPEYEMQQLKVFGQMVQNGLIYRAYKPVPWSPSSRTALAEAEIEYMDKSDRSLYVCFPLTLGPKLLEYAKTVPEGQEVARKAEEGSFKVNAVIWTTTAWSLPSNMAMNINPDLSYSIVRATEGSRRGQQFIVATDAVAQFEKVRLGLSGQGSKLRPQVGPVETILQFPGSCLLDSTYRHPFLPSQSVERPILPASYVTTTDGTGLVHSAPAHGKDDFKVWSDHCRTSPDAAKEDIINLVDERGSFSGEFDTLARDLGVDYGEIAGKSALGQGSREIVHLLEKQRWLLGERTYLHSYPHDWRSKLPLITRATSQWFANVDKIKEDAIRALEKVRFVPETGRARLEAFVRGRSEWCISRQRSWGVPIPVLYNSEDNTPLMTTSNIEYIISVLTAKGTDYWWKGEAEEFLEPKEREKGKKYYKGLDTMDVWFDSGTAWSQSTSAREHVREKADSLIESPPKPHADVYIEGSDQHRGWFQSSLLTYLATAASPDKGIAPFRMVITHGFLVDKRKKKMSKSEGNVISPEFFLLGGPKQKDPSYGADAVRWWVARVDYTHEIVVSSLVIKHASDELRKIRNTFRFLLSYAPKPGQRPAIDPERFGFIEQYMLLQLATFSKECQQAYDACNFALVTRRAAELCTSYISAFYLIVTKDTLYCSSENDKYRQSVVVLIDELLRTLLSVIAPIAPHLAEEVWHFYMGATGPPSIDAGSTPSTSYFRNVWHKGPTLCDAEQGKEILGDMKVAFTLRDSVLATLEEKRQKKAVRSGQEVRLSLLLPKDRERDVAALQRRIDDLAQIFGVSEVAIVDSLPDQGDNGEIWPVVDICRKTQVKFALQPSRHHECPRCRMFKRSKEESTCDRCASVLREIGFNS